MNKKFSDYYKKKLKKALSTTSTWVSIVIVFFINLFSMKRLGYKDISQYIYEILFLLITFIIIYSALTYIKWKKLD